GQKLRFSFQENSKSWGLVQKSGQPDWFSLGRKAQRCSISVVMKNHDRVSNLGTFATPVFLLKAFDLLFFFEYHRGFTDSIIRRMHFNETFKV
ncbi:MAG: hypothetical protein LUC43_07190, partial [Burkholderiales bacterium]|nr:hypothetical protein [Burkholderiales bacterium]